MCVRLMANVNATFLCSEKEMEKEEKGTSWVVWETCLYDSLQARIR